jgi:hypothetical protein
MDPQVGQFLDGLPINLCSNLCPCIYFDRRNSELIFLRHMCGPIPQLGAMTNLWIWSLQVLSPLCWVFQLMSSLLGPGSFLLSWHLGPSGGFSQFPIPLCYTPMFNFLTLCTFPLCPSTLDPALFFPSPPPLFSPSLVHSLPPMIILSPLLNSTEASKLWSFFFLTFIWSVSCIMCISSFFPNIHLSVNTNNVCSFVTVLPHSGLYFPVTSICLRIHEVIVFNDRVVFYCVNVPYFHIFYIQSSFEELLSSFQLLAIKNMLAMNIVKHVFLLPVGTSSGYMPRRGIAVSSSSTMSNFLRNHQTDFQSGCTSLQSYQQVFLFFHIFASICCHLSFYFSHSA